MEIVMKAEKSSTAFGKTGQGHPTKKEDTVLKEFRLVQGTVPEDENAALRKERSYPLAVIRIYSYRFRIECTFR